MSQANKYIKIILRLEAENKELRKIIIQQVETIAQQEEEKISNFFLIKLQAKRTEELEAIAIVYCISLYPLRDETCL